MEEKYRCSSDQLQIKLKLSQEDVKLFYKLYHSLWLFAVKELDIALQVNSPDEFISLPYELVLPIREELYENPGLIDSFIIENPFKFTANQLEIVESWKNFIVGEFLVFRYLKKYTIFLDVDDQPKAYGVLSLNSSFEEMLGNELPVMVKAVLLPFKNKIIYDGILIWNQVRFSGNIRKSFNDFYQEAKFKYGIITSLPLPEESEKGDTDLLKFYLKSKRNQENYWEEIDNLLDKKPELWKVYHQETGKLNARGYGRKLRGMGVKQGWFALLEGEIIASGVTKDDVYKTLEFILPKEKRDFPYVFQLKKK
ncbi:MAG: hypothetical protein KO316_02810 [Methanobacterium sp.]|nr:hypothetical protein [Methanobacterium sp.]